MKSKSKGKKIISIDINPENKSNKKINEIEIRYDKNNYLITKYEYINQILNQNLNLICFDCRKKSPKYISINNAIFLCSNCALFHKKNLPENVSLIIENNLNLINIKYLQYIFFGGNQNLDNFINYVYPGLQNYPPQILYRTQALFYYRENLKYKIKEVPKPKAPNELMAYKILSENGLINIRDKNIFYKDLNISLDNSNVNNDVINNYYNNYNNTYNTYNSININNNTSNNNNNPSLSNKAFFNKMKNLFGKKSIKNYKQSFQGYKGLTPIKSFNNISKRKSDNKNELNEYTSQPLTYRLNQSFNYTLANEKKYRKVLSFLNKSNSSQCENTIGEINYDISPRYIKPNISYNSKKNNSDNNNKFIANKKLKKIYNNRSKFNNILQQKNILKSLKNNMKQKSFNHNINNNNETMNEKNKNKITINPNIILNINKNILNDKIFVKEKLLKKLNKSKENKKNKLYLYTDYMNKSNDIIIPKSKSKTKNMIMNYNYNNKPNNILTKKNNFNNNINASFDGYKRKPIKVNLRNNININLNNKKNLKLKTEKEKLNEEETINNIYFDNYDNNIFTNIVYMNRTNEE